MLGPWRGDVGATPERPDDPLTVPGGQQPRRPAAIRLYQTWGYAPIDDHNGYPYTSFWGEKVLLD
ncbi:MAG TPA: hypothetical protein VLL25_15760 [Acidimicrobiales bacterium]|nr:hypothetical protein [Acidimicrobiales bacterium]